MDGYTVGEVARLARISVRTLHHYDGIGLLTPSARSAGGYRLYSETDLDRLRRVLFYRELEFGLDQIAEILSDAATGTDDHLRRQHRLLRDRRARDEALLRAIEKEMEARAMGISLTPEEQFEIFGTENLAEAHRQHISRWFYDCDYEMHCGLADIYVSDPRFTAAYDDIEPGFSQYVHDAIYANAERGQAKSG